MTLAPGTRLGAYEITARFALNMRHGKDRWISDLARMRPERLCSSSAKTRILLSGRRWCRGFTLCECNDGVAEVRKQLFREAIYDTDPIVIRLAIRGAADLQIADMVQRVVQLLDNDDENVRHTAATAVQAYGREVAGYANEIRAAAAKEKNAEIREIF